LFAFLIFFQIGGGLYLLIERGVLGDTSQYPVRGNYYNFWTTLETVLSISALLGILLGILEEYVFKNLL
jgi:hypothetical protein